MLNSLLLVFNHFLLRFVIRNASFSCWRQVHFQHHLIRSCVFPFYLSIVLMDFLTVNCTQSSNKTLMIMVYCSFGNIAIFSSNMCIEYIQFYLGSLKLYLCVCLVFVLFTCFSLMREVANLVT